MRPTAPTAPTAANHAETNAPVVLITGASRGIGKVTALLFHAKGWRVAAAMRRPDRDGAWAPDRLMLTPALDLLSPDSIRACVDRVIERFGRIDVLVNNAGYALMGPLEAQSDDDLDEQFRTNVLGLMALTREVLPGMRAQGSGCIVNLSSVGGRMSFPLTSAYHATKFAVEGLSESWRFELAPLGIRVKIVEPGGIRTDFISRGSQWRSHSAYAAPVQAMQAATAKLDPRLPGPARVAKAIFRAATDGTSRLRYPAHARTFLALRAMLPDVLWRTLVRWVLLDQSPCPSGGRGRSSGAIA